MFAINRIIFIDAVTHLHAILPTNEKTAESNRVMGAFTSHVSSVKKAIRKSVSATDLADKKNTSRLERTDSVSTLSIPSHTTSDLNIKFLLLDRADLRTKSPAEGEGIERAARREEGPGNKNTDKIELGITLNRLKHIVSERMAQKVVKENASHVAFLMTHVFLHGA
eukprot:CAMPEP_0182430060 /NCGR_PEP_ID=MMETSP1167-20130531/36427_1 /TAXON_ID=2988 /ORGANISM="Mallomonas Sp, Strain CCMP3275" /LENGTH=166 /DNA_ID=CAMNT_0024614659 /DNA_START=1 /DNA_END=501 /DNA_ORIENTATION=-